MQQKWHLGKHVRRLQINACWLECLCHLHRHVRQYLLLLLEASLLIVNLDLSWLRLRSQVLVHTLLKKALGVKFLSDPYRKLQMFAYEAFKLFGPGCLQFLLDLDGIVVANYFLDRFPKHRNHFGDRACLFAEFRLLVFYVLLLLYNALAELFATAPDVLFRVVGLFLVLTVEVFLHPLHLLEKKLEVGPASAGIKLFLRELGGAYLCHGFAADIFQLLSNFGVLCPQ